MRRKQDTGGATRWRLLVGLLCVVLAVFAGTLSVTHAHEQGGPVHGDCGFCATAHASTLAASAAPEGPVAAVVAWVEPHLPLVRPRIVPRSALLIRPPPVMAYLVS